MIEPIIKLDSMETILNKISDIIEAYESGNLIHLEELRSMLRELSSTYYFLTKHNIEAFQNHNKLMYNHKGSVASGLIFADLKVPELRLTRKILYATDRVLNSMRSEIAILRAGIQ